MGAQPVAEAGEQERKIQEQNEPIIIRKHRKQIVRSDGLRGMLRLVLGLVGRPLVGRRAQLQVQYRVLEIERWQPTRSRSGLLLGFEARRFRSQN